MREEPVRYKVSEFRFQPVNASDI